MSAEMKRLEAAHTRVSAAKSELADSAKAAEKAREFAAEIAVEVVEHARRNEELAASRAATLKQALRLGSTTPFPKTPRPASDHAARREAEDRQKIAKHALTELVAEETQAQRRLDEAIAELHAAARAVIGTEVDEAIAAIAESEAKAMRHRIEVDGLSRAGVVGWGTQIELSDAGKKILVGNTMTAIGVKNAMEWLSANASAQNWRDRFEALIASDETPVDKRRRGRARDRKKSNLALNAA